MDLKRIYFYIVVTLLTAFIINENLIQWALAIFVGEMNFIEGFKDAFKYFTFGDYVFFTGFRLIPYLGLWFALILLYGRRNDLVPPVFWGGILGIVFLNIYGSWVSLRPFYTDEHVSSTTSLVFLFLPFYSIITGVLGALFGIFVYAIMGKTNGNREA